MKIKWLKIALMDLDDIMIFISKDNPKIANRIVNIIWDSVKILKNSPELGKPGRVLNTRELIITGLPYIIPYRVKNNQIEILRIIHSSRNYPEQ